MSPAVHAEHLQEGIEKRQRELNDLAVVTSVWARRLTFLSAAIKILLIVLGAFSALKGAIPSIWSNANPNATLGIAGFLVAVLTSIEATFKLDQRGARLHSLSLETYALTREIHGTWRRRVGRAIDEAAKIDALEQVSDLLDKKRDETQKTANDLGVNVVLFLRFGRKAIMNAEEPNYNA